MPLSPSTLLQLHTDIRQTRVSDEGIILRQEDGEILVVNEVAIRFVELIDGNRNLDELTDILLQEYKVDRSTLADDLAEYASELISHNVLSITAS